MRQIYKVKKQKNQKFVLDGWIDTPKSSISECKTAIEAYVNSKTSTKTEINIKRLRTHFMSEPVYRVDGEKVTYYILPPE